MIRITSARLGTAACLFVALQISAGTLVRAQAQDEHLTRRLEWFQDLKFGLFLHWGAYSQLGCIESWPMVWEDRNWSNPAIHTKEEMVEFRKKYFALNRTFNPVAFDPDAWAGYAKAAGMKYVVLTTKHHDGFSMFDTRQTDYRVTAPQVPFSRDPRANIAFEVFRAFRAKGFGIGAYFSKSDWHSPYYWRPDVFALDRNPNYDTAADPERWAKFVGFVHGQIRELMTGYGNIDILWLDGGQVVPPKQDIQMEKLGAMARSYQRDLIMVNRDAGDAFEDYLTPEQKVPDKPLARPWESCITMAKQFSYNPNDVYKSTHELIHMLVNIVAKGGNLLLNIGPSPEGTLPDTAVSRLKEIGAWMAVNSEAIYGTRPIAPYRDGRCALTRKGNAVYAIYLADEGENTLPRQIRLASVHPAAGSSIRLLGSPAELSWTRNGEGTIIDVPDALRKSPPSRDAFVFQLTQ
jgi:alpha-L-fucosidase